MSNEATFAKSAVSTPEGRRWRLFTASVIPETQEENLMRTLTNHSSDCELPNLGYTNK